MGKMQKDNIDKRQDNKATNKNSNAERNDSNYRQSNYKRKPRYNNNYNYRGPRNDDSILSVVIPLYNEEESLAELSLQLEAELEKVASKRWEVIFIDDGSIDDSFEVLKQICSRNNKFRAIRFRRNFGKSAALNVGFKEAKGIIVITMDADLQDDPAEIQNLIAKLKEGYDLVSGWKKKRRDPISKTLPSKLFNFVTSKMSGLKLHDFNCGLKAYRRDVVKSVQVYGEMHRYIPALAHWDGFRVAEIPVTHHPRRFGKSKFGMSRFLKGFLDLLTIMFTSRYLKRPLHFFGTIGSLFAGTGFIIDLWLAIEWMLGLTDLTNRPLVLLGIAFIIVGVQLISLGLLGEMIVKNAPENQNYSIKERLN